MKKFVQNNTKLVVIVLSIFLFLLILISLILIINKNGSKSDLDKNSYEFANSVKEEAGTKIITNDDLKQEKCLDNICVSDVVIYSLEGKGRLKCIIMNKSTKTKSGYLKIKVDKYSLIVGYENLGYLEKTTTTAQYRGATIKDVDGYSLEKLTKEEKSRLFK